MPAVVVTGDVTGLHVIDPDVLAETYWQLYTRRDRIEYRYPTLIAD